MALRVTWLLSLGVALGYTTPAPPRAEEASASPAAAAADPLDVSLPRATPATVSHDAEPIAPREVAPPTPMAKAKPAATREVVPPRPVAKAKPAATRGLPPYEVTGRTTSPDGATWCILDLKLHAASVTPEKLRAVWADLRRQETVDWKRLTCRVSGPHGSVDVNEFAILRSVPSESLDPMPPSPWVSVLRRDLADRGPAVEDGEIVLVEEGEDYVVFEVDGVEIKVPKRR